VLAAKKVEKELKIYFLKLEKKLENGESRAAAGGLLLEVVYFSKNNFLKNSKNNIQFFEKLKKIEKKITTQFVLF
jgi:hypothetical protein